MVSTLLAEGLMGTKSKWMTFDLVWLCSKIRDQVPIFSTLLQKKTERYENVLVLASLDAPLKSLRRKLESKLKVELATFSFWLQV